MKKLKLIALMLFLCGTCNIQAQSCQNLFFSEYLEGASNNKALEIYNPTGQQIDLTNYLVYRYNNGSPTPTDSIFPQGMLMPGGVYVFGNPVAILDITSVSDTMHTITFFNGDDALELVRINPRASLDVIGQIGTDPGTNWVVGTGATSEFTLVRKTTIQQGNTNWAVNATEWDVYPQNTTTYLGSHMMNPCCTDQFTTVYDTLCYGDSLYLGDSVYYQSGTYQDTITIAGGCDSIVTFQLYVHPQSIYSQAISVCYGDSIIINTHVYTQTGQYIDTLTTPYGCDSIITTNLIVYPPVDTTVVDTLSILIAVEDSAAYVWLDCNNAMAPIPGAINQLFTPTSSGSFAVAVTRNGCTDTSACHQFVMAGYSIIDYGDANVYPNPSKGVIYIDAGRHEEILKAELFTATGVLVKSETYYNARQIVLKTSSGNGVYYLMLYNGQSVIAKKKIVIIKQGL